MDGLVLTFRLAGINNQNFLMQDEQTGSFWQQISGVAIAGPMAGRHLTLIPSDELSFGLWRKEQPRGTVLREASGDAATYAKKDWETRMQSTPTVLSYAEGALTARTLVVGIQATGGARAYPHATVLAEKLILDTLGGVPVMLVAGPDGKSIRGFLRNTREFYRLEDGGEAVMMDDATGSRWNFQGCAVTGSAAGSCLERVEIRLDYWFDWRHYHPETTVFRTGPRR